MLPLLFTFKAPIFGRGFIADVEICGRVLAELEADGVWLYGVNPGGFALDAPTLTDAGPATTKALVALFVDFADEAKSYNEFAVAVTKFFDETDPTTVAEWEAGLKAVRDGKLCAPAGLKVTKMSQVKFGVTIKQRVEVTPKDNPIVQQQREDESQLAAAA